MKRFMYGALGILALSLSFGYGAQAIHSATAATLAAQPTEVATLSGILPEGAQIPLPTYADGTPATESECRWQVSINEIVFVGNSALRCFTSNSADPSSTAPGRYVHCVAFGGGPFDYTRYGTVNYLIIATRQVPSGPIATEGTSWSAVKTRYR